MILEHVLLVGNKNYILNFLNLFVINQDWIHIAKIVLKMILKYFRYQFCYALRSAIKNNNNYCLFIIGCNAQFLKLWFEFQFNENRNWGNYGNYFHLDNVKPCSLFNIEDDNDRRLMNHGRNLSLLEKYENMTKSNKYNDEIELYLTTKILKFLDHINNTNTDLCKFAIKSYSNSVEVLHSTQGEVKCPQ